MRLPKREQKVVGDGRALLLLQCLRGIFARRKPASLDALSPAPSLESDACRGGSCFAAFQASAFAEMPLSIDRGVEAFLWTLRARCRVTEVPTLFAVSLVGHSPRYYAAESPALRQLARELTPIALEHLRRVDCGQRRGVTLLGSWDTCLQRLEAFGGSAVCFRGWSSAFSSSVLLFAILRSAQGSLNVQLALQEDYLEECFELHLSLCSRAEALSEEYRAGEAQTIGLVHDAKAANERALALLLSNPSALNGRARAILLEELFTSVELQNEILGVGRELEHSPPVPLADFFPSLVERLQLFCRGAGVSLRVSGQIHSRIKVPSTAVKRILSNYVMNAMRHAAGGSLEIDVRCLDAEIKFRVKDGGQGLTGVSQVSLDSFDAPREKTRGSRVGLQSCTSLARAHGGYAWFEPSTTLQSAASSGATFGVAFPIPGEASVPDAGTRAARVLLIEDDAALLRCYARDISAVVARIETATSLSEARGRLSAGDFECIVSDFRLEDGVLLSLAEVRERQIPVLVCTGGMTESERAAMRDMAEVYFLEKPVGRNELRSVIQHVLSKGGYCSGVKAAAVV